MALALNLSNCSALQRDVPSHSGHSHSLPSASLSSEARMGRWALVPVLSLTAAAVEVPQCGQVEES